MANVVPFPQPVEPRTGGAGFRPYLVTRLLPAVYRPEALSPFDTREAMLAIARRRAASTRLSVCLVLAPNNCVYVEPDGTIERSADLPRGGFRFSVPGIDFP